MANSFKLILLRYHTPAPAAGFAPEPDSALINGLGRVPGGRSPLAVIRVSYGKKYRFRLINMACDPSFMFSIDNHMMVWNYFRWDVQTRLTYIMIHIDCH
jgi:iron transport multicopper oxidase